MLQSGCIGLYVCGEKNISMAALQHFKQIIKIHLLQCLCVSLSTSQPHKWGSVISQYVHVCKPVSLTNAVYA